MLAEITCWALIVLLIVAGFINITDNEKKSLKKVAVIISQFVFAIMIFIVITA